MWMVMMVAMMLPTASPMILTFAKLNHAQSKTDKILSETAIFAVAYVVVWLAFSLLFTLLQEAFLAVGLVSGMMAKANMVFGGIILISAGIYQFTPLKDACLRACQTPLGFLMTRWKEGPLGAFRMGVEHGIYCVGCCWALMLLMFVGGVMDLFWMVILAVLMLGEKMMPPGHWLPQAFGAGLVLWGVLLLVTHI
jgi:predicted metal-binding membrane protein